MRPFDPSSIARSVRSPIVWGALSICVVARWVVPEWILPISLVLLAVWAITASRRRLRWITLRRELQSFDGSKGPQGRVPMRPFGLLLLSLLPPIVYLLFVAALPQIPSAPNVVTRDLFPLLILPLAAVAMWLSFLYRDQADAAPTRADLDAMEAEIEVQAELRRLQAGDEAMTPLDRPVETAPVDGPIAQAILGSRIASKLEDVVDVVEHTRSTTAPLPGEVD